MKVLVVHPAQQHSYRLATALKKKGYLYKYLTTVYYKKGSFTYLLSCVLKGNIKKKAKSRVCQELNSSDVIQFCEVEGLLKLLVMNVIKVQPYYKKLKYHTTDRFARKVVHYAVRHKVDAVICYDDYSAVLFEMLAKQAPNILRIMDISAANILYMRHIYEKDVELQPDFSERLYKEREIVWCEDNIERTKKELKYGQVFLSPSRFVAKTLNYSGISGEQIHICPYGVDTKMFAQKKYFDFDKPLQRPIRFVYVGGVKELKGISYLLQAIEEIDAVHAELIIVGQCDKKAKDIKRYLDRVIFTGPVLHSEVPNILMQSDVFVFPSLGEGLSLSALEAASCGLPLIVTENSGVNDAMTDGKEGFVIPIQSTEALVEKMEWFIQHPDLIESMGKAARKMALHYTWDAYYQHISQIFDEIGITKNT